MLERSRRELEDATLARFHVTVTDAVDMDLWPKSPNSRPHSASSHRNVSHTGALRAVGLERYVRRLSKVFTQYLTIPPGPNIVPYVLSTFPTHALLNTRQPPHCTAEAR